MKKAFSMLALSLILWLVSSTVHGDTADILEDCIGYTVVATKTIEGYVDEDGEKDDSFEGCDFDRVIRFNDGSSLTCSTFSYSYSYRPTAVLLAKSTQLGGRKFVMVRMIVADEIYDMEPIVER